MTSDVVCKSSAATDIPRTPIPSPSVSSTAISWAAVLQSPILTARQVQMPTATHTPLLQAITPNPPLVYTAASRSMVQPAIPRRVWCSVQTTMVQITPTPLETNTSLVATRTLLGPDLGARISVLLWRLPWMGAYCTAVSITRVSPWISRDTRLSRMRPIAILNSVSQRLLRLRLALLTRRLIRSCYLCDARMVCLERYVVDPYMP